MELKSVEFRILEKAANAEIGIRPPRDCTSEEHRVFMTLTRNGLLELKEAQYTTEGVYYNNRTCITEKGRNRFEALVDSANRSALYEKDSGEYQRDAMRTLSTIEPDIPAQLLHGALGLCTEVGELQDAIKKMFYGRNLDKNNIIEELGDIEWYMVGIRSVLEISQAEVQARNIEKLQLRYTKGFDAKEAVERADKAEQND